MNGCLICLMYFIICYRNQARFLLSSKFFSVRLKITNVVDANGANYCSNHLVPGTAAVRRRRRR